MGWIAGLKKSSDALSSLVNAFGIVLLIFLMLITVADVCLRYFFSMRVVGTYELTEFALVVSVFLGMAYTMTQGGHVGVEVFVSLLPSRIRLLVEYMTLLLSLFIFCVITWRSVLFALAQGRRGLTSLVLHLPVSPFILVAAFGAFLLCVILAIRLMEMISGAWKQGDRRLRLALALGTVVVLLFLVTPFWLRTLEAGVGSLGAGAIAIALLFVVLFSGMPIGFGMALIGFLGMSYMTGPDSGLAMMGRVPYTTVGNYMMSVLPLYVLMGSIIFSAGISGELYHAAHRWVGHLPGGLAMATIAACAGFAAVCGSSVATAATIGTIALPEMRRYQYEPGLAAGTVAAGGTLGFLIPPSLTFCVIGLIAEQSIGKLFMAGILPGILLTLLFMVTIWIMTRRYARTGVPAIARPRFSERIASLKGIWGIMALFLLVIGGIYLGIFTPTEAAGIGAFGAFLVMLVSKKLTWKNVYASLLATGQTTAMIFTIWIGAISFGNFFTVTGLPGEMVDFISALPVSRYTILAAIIVIYIILGCIMEFLAIALFTVPLVFPLLTGLGFDPIWLGVIITICAEMALITPPVGMNVYVIAGMAKDVPMFTVFRGAMLFFLAMVVCIVILTIFPEIALFLPGLLK
ncbi:MAG: TRAP transporter large permease subunit [Thermodesulfobacteriota bacterium]